MNINWDKSFILTADQVATLGLEHKSIAELGTRHMMADRIPDLAHLADALENLTLADLARWQEAHDANDG